MAREPQLASLNRKMIDGSVDSMGYFRELGPYLGLTFVVSGDYVGIFSDPPNYEMFKESDVWQKDVQRKGMPFVLTGQTGYQVVSCLSRLATTTPNGLPEILRLDVDIAHVDGFHMSGLRADFFVKLEQCWELEKAFLSENKSSSDLAGVIYRHDHLHLPTINQDDHEVLAFLKLHNGDHVIPVFSGPDLAYGATNSAKLGLREMVGADFFTLFKSNPELCTQTIGILFNPYTNTEKFMPWASFQMILDAAPNYSQSA